MVLVAVGLLLLVSQVLAPKLNMPITIDAGQTATPSVNTAAVITYAAVADKQHNVDTVVWSYSGTPSGGNLKIEDGTGNTVFSIDITAPGPGFIPFKHPHRGSVNTDMIITLASVSGVSGKVSVGAHWLTNA